ncbi:MAG: hypothetical protein K2Y23_15575 [Cyanobacteria bacterium]|nr:hypothetical protein [Cyanobacteriota bacterium]
MRKAVLLLSLALMAGPIPAVADQARANPYSRLFETRDLLTKAMQERSVPPAGQPKPKVACGMTIIEAPPFFDQKMKVEPRKDPNVRYTIRAVEPTICSSK